MYALSGFIKIAAMVSNQPSVDSVLGELSQRSATFSRELGHYSNASFPDVKLTSFNSARDGVLVEVDPTYSTISLQISQWLFLRSIDGSLSDDKENCRQQLLAQFNGAIEILTLGQMVNNGNYWLPEQLIFSVVGGGEENVIRLWYSDAAFQAQYDLYEILVVPIVEPLDDLHGNRENVLQILNAITVPVVLNKVDVLVGAHPPTEIVSNEYDWTDKNDPTIVKATPWTVVVYGDAGNNADLIREALVEWILDNSDYPREEWEKIYPDLFLPNEFYITPTWDRYSIPNQLTIGGIYSPTLKYAEMFSYAVSTFFQIPTDHIRQYMSHSTSVYKSLGFVAIGNPRNRNGIYAFDDLWPEYASITTSNHDFNRMSPETSEFIMLLINVFMTAESLTAYSSLPQGISRVTRGDLQYLAVTYKKMLYLVSLKSNQIEIIEDPDAPGEPGTPFVPDRLQLAINGLPIEHHFLIRKGSYRGYQFNDSVSSDNLPHSWSTSHGYTHRLSGSGPLKIVTGQYDDVIGRYVQLHDQNIGSVELNSSTVDYAVNGNRCVLVRNLGAQTRIDVLESDTSGNVTLLDTYYDSDGGFGSNGVFSVTVHPDGTWFCIAAIDGSNVGVYRITTNGIVKVSLASITTLNLNAELHSVLKFSLDGNWLYAALPVTPNDGAPYTKLRKYVITGTSISSPVDVDINVGPSPVYRIAVNKNGSIVATAQPEPSGFLNVYRIASDGSFTQLGNAESFGVTDFIHADANFGFSKNGRFGYLTDAGTKARIYEMNVTPLLAQTFDVSEISTQASSFSHLHWRV